MGYMGIEGITHPDKEDTHNISTVKRYYNSHQGHFGETKLAGVNFGEAVVRFQF